MMKVVTVDFSAESVSNVRRAEGDGGSGKSEILKNLKI